MKINFGRVLLGGLVAGFILNVGEWVLNGIVLAKDMQEFFKKCSNSDRQLAMPWTHLGKSSYAIMRY